MFSVQLGNEMKTPLQLDVGLADSELISYEKTGGGNLEVRILAWNARQLIFTFTDVIGVLDLCAGDFSEVIEETERTQFFQSALEYNYIGEPSNHSVPDHHPYHLYQFLNHDDLPSLEVVAEKFEAAIKE
jgi:hypothetical protein